VAEPTAAAERLKQAEERAARLVKTPTVAAAKEALGDADVVVRYQALQVLAAKDPRAVAARAAELLRVPHDPFRYEVCEVLEKTGDRSAAPALEAPARKPEGSLNPNVLRIRAVQALARCGGESSVPVVAPFATTGNANNTLTGTAVDALGAIASRTPRAKAAVKAALVESYPPPGGSGAEGPVGRSWRGEFTGNSPR
jgi:HEAT repeat protein